MITSEFSDRLSARASSAGVTLPADAKTQLERYFRILAHWNRKINLTALPLCPPTDEAFDRLLIEPIVAARFSAGAPQAWFDVGSGGGSPAIPFKIVQPAARLTLVESKSRKAAFLREVARELDLSGVCVLEERFATVSETDGTLDLITVRAVKRDPVLFRTIHRLLAPNGRVFLFHSPDAAPVSPRQLFSTVEVVRLGTSKGSLLTILAPLFHVEQSR